MLNVTKQLELDAITITLSGTIDETDDFAKLVGPIKTRLRVVASQVTRINSIGTKTWLKYFSDLYKANVTFVFEQLAPALVEQLNLVRNFACGGEVISVLVPFRCGACKELIQLSMTTADFKVAGRELAEIEVKPVKCPKCSGSAEFDDLPEEYFIFLRH